MSLTVTFNHESTQNSTVQPVGSITAATAQTLKSEVIKQIPYLSGSLVFDLSHVPMIDSTGVGILVNLKKQITKAGHGFGMINVQDTVAKALEIMRMSEHLHCFVNREELDRYLINIQQKMMSPGDDNPGA